MKLRLFLFLFSSLIAATESMNSDNSPIEVELFVMSRCPDAHFTESLFERVIRQYNIDMEAQEERRSVELGQYLLSSEPLPSAPREVRVRLEFLTGEDGSCMHGELECQGNAIELCVQETAEKENKTSILEFVIRYNSEPSQIGNTTTLPATLSQDGLDVSRIMRCVEEGRGTDMLIKSSAYAKSLDISKSAIVRINRTIVGVRDGGVWTYLGPGLDGSERAWIQFLKHARE